MSSIQRTVRMLKKIIIYFINGLLLFSTFIGLLLVWVNYDIKAGRKAAEADSQPHTYPIRNSNFGLYTDWKTFYPQFSKDILEAKEYVYIHYFSIGSGEASEKFFDLLKKKANQGVEVYYSVDRAGSLKGKNDWFDELRKAGVHITYSNDPHFPHIWYSIQHRNHRRIAVIDGKIGYTGGLNVAQKYTKDTWHDYQIRMTGEGVQDFEQQFCKDWKVNTGESPPVHKVSLEKGNTNHYLKVYSSGYGVVEDYIKEFDSAKKQIIIATPYFIPDNRDFMDALKRARKRDVEVIIMWPKHSDGLMLTQAAYPFVREALENGMKVYQYDKGIFHGKVVLVDHERLMIGTVNIDSRSFRLNDEMTLFMKSSPFSQTVQKQLDVDLGDSKEIKLDYFDNLKMKDKILMKIAKYVHYYL